MIKTPLSTVIGGAFWTPGATVINGAKLSFEIVMKKLFANGEQGFWYDPSDMGAMFQDAAGTTAVNASGQPLGLVLDKSKGLELSAELFNDSTVQLFGATRLSPSIYRINAPDSTSVNFNIPIQGLRYNWVRIDFEVVRQGSGSARIDYSSGLSYVIPNSVGRHSIIAYCNRADNSIVFIRNTTPTDIDIKINSIKFLAGNQAYQPTSASRPILQDAPRRIDFDTVDDKLITNLPAQLTGCTMIRAVPGVGVQLLTNQTIPATYEDNKDHCGLIVINRALTPSETSAITAEFNKRAGV